MQLTELEVAGLKSFAGGANGQRVQLGRINLVLGANGVGKSSLISIFQLLNYALTGSLQDYIARKGGANSWLHYGPGVTSDIILKFVFEENDEQSAYDLALTFGQPNSLIINSECASYWNKTRFTQPRSFFLSGNREEPALKDDNRPTPKVLYRLLSGLRYYHFHNTSDEAKIRLDGYIDDARYLRADAGNLAAFLFNLSENEGYKPYYQLIERYVSRVFPQFRSFEIYRQTRNRDYVRLNWRDMRSDYLFGPHQLSDGTLRFMALATLLLQPAELMPKVIVLDEPELGLHPAALQLLAGLFQRASAHCQLIIATQSVELVNQFSVNDLIIADRHPLEGFTTLHRPSETEFADWLTEYTTGELWQKNLLGGRP